ncbi:MAG: 16S rRNA (cytidine(1402)-2'-O)-methyltransferase, partial [Candidatus Limnocylindrales bacterium]
YEEVVRGTLPELVAWAEGGVRGEVTLVLAGAEERQEDLTSDELVRLVRVREAAGLTRKEAMAAVASETGQPRAAVYDALVRAKTEAKGSGDVAGP